MNSTLKLYGALAVVALVTVAYLGRKAGQGAAAVADAVNPLNPGNLAYSGVNAVGGALAGDNGRNADGSWTFGGWLYDVTHPGWSDLNRPGPSSDPLDFINTPNPNSSSTWGA